MKLTKKQKDELFNYHSGVGVLIMKTKDNEISMIDFYIDESGKVRYLTNTPAPELNLNEFVRARSQ